MSGISVIVPVYNTEKYLSRCVDSILCQTLEDFELILIDDGSTDLSGTICDEYAAVDHRITVIHQKNMGQAAARNTGLDSALEKEDCEWIAFVDSDDAVHPQMLELLYKKISGTSEKTVAGDCLLFHGAEAPTSENVREDSVKTVSMLPEEFYVGCPYLETVSWGKLYHRSCFESIRYPEGKMHEDRFVTYKIIFSLSSVLHIEYPLYYYFHNPDGITKSRWKPGRLTAFEAFSEQLDFFEKNGYKAAEDSTAYHSAIVLRDQIRELEKTGEYRKYLGIMRKMMRKHLKKYRSHPHMGLTETPSFYTAAYPQIEMAYSVLRPVRKIIRACSGFRV